MDKGWLALMGKLRGITSRALILSFMLPLLLGVLPARALSAEDALLLDLAGSYCSTGANGSPSDAGDGVADRRGICVLCITGTPSTSRLSPASVGVISKTEHCLFAVPQLDRTARLPVHSIPAHDGPPRGPPSSRNI